MKRLILITLLLLPLVLPAQEEAEENIIIVDDESCGCELFFVDSIQTTKRGGLFGFKLADGRELVTPRYKFVDKWHGEYCLVYLDYGQCGLIDRSGREIVPCEYAEVNYPTDSMIRVSRNDRYGYLRLDGSEAIPLRYQAASTFSEGLAVVENITDSLFLDYVYIDHNGNTVLDDQYQYAYPFLNGYAVVKKYDRFGIIDRQGRERLTFRHNLVTGVSSDGLFVADDPHNEPAKLALFSTRDFKPLTPYKYDDFIGMGDHHYTYRLDTLYGYLDTLGREVHGRFDEAVPFEKGYAMVARGGKYGIIDNEGNTVLPLEYDFDVRCNQCYQFHDGRAVVLKGDRFGYCDESGDIVIPFLFESCFGFGNGRAPVKINGLWGYIDTDGQWIVPAIFDAASPFKYGRAEVFYRGNTSKINTAGRCVKACNSFPVWNIINLEK